MELYLRQTILVFFILFFTTNSSLAVLTLQQFREKKPQYADMDSIELATRIYKATPILQESGVSFEEFAQQVGVEEDMAIMKLKKKQTKENSTREIVPVFTRSPVFTRLMMFAATVLPTTILCFFVIYFLVVKTILKQVFKITNLLLSFLLSWFFSSIPGFLYGEPVYNGIYLIVLPAAGSMLSLFLFFCASKNSAV